MGESITFGERAIQLANAAENAQLSKLVFTGRMVVKKMFEDRVMPDDIDGLGLAMYFGPELRPWSRGVIKAMTHLLNPEEDSTRLFFRRLLQLQPSGDGLHELSVFDKNGKVTPQET